MSREREEGDEAAQRPAHQNWLILQSSDTPAVRANMGRVVLYCNRVVRTYLDLQAMNKTNVLLRLEEFQGTVVTTFRGIPVRTCDAILNNEAQVT